VPPSIYEGIVPVAQRLSGETLRGLLPRRARHAHKGDFGRVLVIGGAPGMPGAARLCGAAAYRSGAGMVTLATHPQHAAAINVTRPELMVYGVRSAAVLKPQLERATVIALGPGLGRGAWGKQLFTAALAARRPLVIDADGLYFFLAHLRKQRADWVLTPHAGEAARLLGCTAEEIERDRFAAVRAITEKFGGVCVLKGAGTLIAAHDSRGGGGRVASGTATEGDSVVYLCDRGNPGMASGGMGDVLTGVVAALRAQSLSALDAARLGVWVHATAGDAAARSDGEVGLVASDVLARLRAELNRLA
jgi:NAD(P)H-hydrate epimerase